MLRAGYTSIVFVVCCVSSGLCEGLIIRPEGAYRVCVCMCVCVSDLETLRVRRSQPEWGRCAIRRKLEAVTYLEVVGHEVRALSGSTYVMYQCHRL